MVAHGDNEIALELELIVVRDRKSVVDKLL